MFAGKRSADLVGHGNGSGVNGCTSLMQNAGIVVGVLSLRSTARFWRWSDAEEGEEGKARSDLLRVWAQGRSGEIPIKKNDQLRRSYELRGKFPDGVAQF